MDDVTALAIAARDGDRVALSAFVRATQPEVWRLCAALASKGDADDLTQDTYVRAFRALPSFRGDSSARTWLLAIARHAALDGIRISQRLRRLSAAVGGAARTVEPDPAGLVGARALVRSLDPERRTAFVLTQVLGLSYAEAAEVCGCPVGTIRSRVARARADLIGDAREAASP